MENLEIYEKVRSVPETAKREIAAGRLKGKTDINPMWRLKKLTEIFGPVGKGWYTVDKRKWTEIGANGEIAAFVDLDLYVKFGEEWSKAIPGTGGSMLVAREKNGLYTDDEAYKKAYTDAISVAAKALGIGADVYWDKDTTKYPHGDEKEPPESPKEQSPAPKGAVWAGQKRRAGIKLSELRDFGVENISGISKYLAEKFGKPIAQLDEEETETAWAYLRRKKAREESATSYENAMQDDRDLPWENPTDEEGNPL